MKTLTIQKAIDLLVGGEIVAIPTETVYGLAADARSDEAVSKIFKAKGRPSDNPLIVHIGDIAQVDHLAIDVSEKARLLMDHFWPGPLTVILSSTDIISGLVTAGLTTVGLRMPSHQIALKLLRKSGIPLAAPSANISGKPSPTSAMHVRNDLKDRITGFINGGTCNIGLESTVIDMTTDVPIILRPGSITRAEIEIVIGDVDSSDATFEKPKAPGMKYAHYAPKAKIFIVRGSLNFFRSLIKERKENGLRVGVLCHTSSRALYKKAHVVLPLEKQGKNLYDSLREFDNQGADVILSEDFGNEAVMNRLLKASENRVLNEDQASEERISSEVEN